MPNQLSKNLFRFMPATMRNVRSAIWVREYVEMNMCLWLDPLLPAIRIGAEQSGCLAQEVVRNVYVLYTNESHKWQKKRFK